VGNERIFENLQRLLATGTPVWIRIPVIPSVNDTVEEMKGIKAMLDRFGAPQKVELLPYHAMGEHKYAAIGKEAVSFSVPDEEAMERFRRIFSSPEA
jgi:pyruvate formate lyase activating enzyme